MREIFRKARAAAPSIVFFVSRQFDQAVAQAGFADHDNSG